MAWFIINYLYIFDLNNHIFKWPRISISLFTVKKLIMKIVLNMASCETSNIQLANMHEIEMDLLMINI